MTDHSELKRLAEAFPADLDWDSNTEPFFNGPTGESLGGGATGFYSVFGKPFRIEGEDYDYDGPTYVEACHADFAKFMVAARDGVLALIAENERLESERAELWRGKRDAVASSDTKSAVIAELRTELAGLRTGYDAYEGVVAGLKAEVEALRKDAPRLDRLDMECEAYGTDFHEDNRWVVEGPFATVRDAIDAAMSKEAGHD